MDPFSADRATRGRPPRPGRPGGRAGYGRRRPVRQGRRGFVVHLEGHREGRVPGQPEPADLAVFAQRAGRAHGVVVEAAGHRHPRGPPRSVRRAASSPPGASRTASTCCASAKRRAGPGSARSRRPPAAPPRPAGRRARPRTGRSRRPGRAPRRWPVPGPRRPGAAAARRARRGRRRYGRAAGPAAPPSSSGRGRSRRGDEDPDEGCGHGRAKFTGRTDGAVVISRDGRCGIPVDPPDRRAARWSRSRPAG